MIIGLILYMVFCTVFFWPGQPDTRGAQELFYQLSATALITLNLLFFNPTRWVKPNSVTKGYAIFVVYSVILFILSRFQMGVTYMLNIFLSGLVFYSVLSIGKEYTRKLLKTIIWIGILNLFYIALQMVDFDFIFNIKNSTGGILEGFCEPLGFFGMKASMGVYMALAGIAMLLVNPILAIVFAFPVYLSLSSGAMFALLCGMFTYYWWMKRKALLVIAPILAVLGVCYFTFVDSPTGMMANRPPLWKMALKDVMLGVNLNTPQIQSPYLKNAMTGYGLDAFRTGPIVYILDQVTHKTVRAIKIGNNLLAEDQRMFYMKDGSMFTPDGHNCDVWDNPHFSVVELIYNFGVIGLVIVGFIFYSMVERFRRSVKTRELVVITALIVTFLASSISQFPFGIARIANLVPILLGLFVLNTEDK